MDFKAFQKLRKRFGAEIRLVFSKVEEDFPEYSYDSLAVYMDSAIAVMYRFRQYLDFVKESQNKKDADTLVESIVDDAIKESENGVS